jgi:hypothetical protein
MNDFRNWRVMVSNVTRNAALHADLPFPRADNWLKANLVKLHETLELDISDPRITLGEGFTIPAVNTSEMTSGNPVHAGIVMLSITAVVGMVLLGKEDPDILVYISAIFFSLIMFCYFLKWQPSGGKLHLPFFILFAPMLAVLLDRLEKFDLEIVIAVLLFAYSLPWLFQTQERPIIPDVIRTYPISIFGETHTLLYFATHPDDYPYYLAITEEIKAREIKEVGLDLTPTSEEYPFWVMLGAPDDDLRIAWMDTTSASSKYLHSEFVPGAIICENCTADAIDRYSKDYQSLSFGDFELFIKEQ